MKPRSTISAPSCWDRAGVGRALQARSIDRFGERGVMDLVGAVGYYSLVSMVLNVERRAAAGGRDAAAEAAVAGADVMAGPRLASHVTPPSPD